MITEASRVGKPPFKPLAALGLFASILGPVVFVIGFGLGYLTFIKEMAGIRVTHTALTEQLVSQEATIKTLSQNIAELKLRAATNR